MLSKATILDLCLIRLSFSFMVCVKAGYEQYIVLIVVLTLCTVGTQVN